MATQATPSSGAVAAALSGLVARQPGQRVSATQTDASKTPVADAADAPTAARPENASADAAVRKLTEALRTASVSIQFEIDSETNRVVTKVVDKANGEIIRQIPTEEVVRIADALAQLQGMLVHQTA